MRRAFAIGTGLILAMATALLVLPATALIAALAGGYGSRLPTSLFDIAVWFAWSNDPGRLMHAAVSAAARTLAIACCAPVICAALIGEAARLSRFAWYVAATAILSAVLPAAAAARSGSWDSLAQPVAAAPLLIAGAAAGLVYWLVAGAAAGREPQPRRTVGAGFGLAPDVKSASETHDS